VFGSIAAQSFFCVKFWELLLGFDLTILSSQSSRVCWNGIFAIDGNNESRKRKRKRKRIEEFKKVYHQETDIFARKC
jgi:hypothetical protein